MILSRWIVRRGRDGAWLYLRLDRLRPTWVEHEADADRFATKADALTFAELFAASTGSEIAVLPQEP